MNSSPYYSIIFNVLFLTQERQFRNSGYAYHAKINYVFKVIVVDITQAGNEVNNSE